MCLRGWQMCHPFFWQLKPVKETAWVVGQTSGVCTVALGNGRVRSGGEPEPWVEVLAGAVG